MIQKKYEYILKTAIVISFLLFIYLSFFWVGFDWDAKFTHAEVDLRSWTINKEIPFWSYQLCGGSTRIGHPNSMGLSPLFLFVLLTLDSYIGIKLIGIFTIFLIFYFGRKFSLLFFDDQNPDKYFWSSLIALFLTFNNYFLYHFRVGHLSFGLFGLGIGVFYFFCKSFLNYKLTYKDCCANILVVSTIFLGGFYPVTMFFLIPLSVGVFSWYFSRILFGYEKLGILFKRYRTFLVSTLIGLSLAFVKIYFVWQYQSMFPRKVGHGVAEQVSLYKTFFLQLVPTFSHDYLLNYPFDKIWSLHERTSFNFIAVICVILFFYSIVSKKSLKKYFHHLKVYLKNNNMLFFIHLLVIGLLFSFGNYYSWTPFALLNKYIFNNSVRVPARYQFLIFFFLIPILSNYLNRNKQVKPLFLKYVYIPTLIGTFYLLVQFMPIKHQLALAELKSNLTNDKMNKMISFNAHQFGSYRLIKESLGILSCYSSLGREIVFKGLVKNIEEKNLINEATLPVIFDRIEREKCIEESYFTQNKLKISNACPPGTCLNINGMNIYNDQHDKFIRGENGYCLK